MAAEPKPHLAVVPDRSTGELLPVSIESLAHELQNVRDEYTQLLRNYKGKCRQLAEYERTKQAEAEADPLWPVALRVFNYCNRVLGHPKAEWNVKRFELVRRVLRRADGLELALRAIAGKATDEWARANKHTTFDDVFETAKKFEKCVARCPADWAPPQGAAGLL